jgi:3-phenylpropionate/cinnamic acid dioxygenase small subunit
MTDESAITNLLYRYAELFDAGDLVGAASLFANATVRRIGPAGVILLRSEELLAFWRQAIVLYPDGTPRTKHLITNPIVEITEKGDSATCRSYYTVYQQLPRGKPQFVTAGRYHDAFRRTDEGWEFASRDNTMRDMVGSLDDHVRQGPSELAAIRGPGAGRNSTRRIAESSS